MNAITPIREKTIYIDEPPPPPAAPLVRHEPRVVYVVRAQPRPVSTPLRFVIAVVLIAICGGLASYADSQLLSIVLAFFVGGVLWWMFPMGDRA